MRRETITRGRIVELTREILHSFYKRSVENLMDYLSDDFVWIGAFDFQFARNKKEFLDIVKAELNSAPLDMSEEHYDLVSRDRDTIILCCRFNLRGHFSNGDFFQMHIRLTVVWKSIENELKIVHIHGSNAQDVPMATLPQTKNEDETDEFIKYVKSNKLNVPASTKMFRLTSGEHKIISEDDILYLKSEGQNTRIYAKDRELTISGILRVHQENLSDKFVRIHKSYLININYLTAFRRYIVLLNDKIELPIGKEKYLKLKNLCVSKYK